MEYTSEPLFTLTAEEVEIFEELLNSAKDRLLNLKPTFEGAERIIKINNLLTRIKQWQNEH